MGQATIDLPDPLDPALAISASGADDLLDELAGKEIDRLLSEGDEPPADRQPPVARSVGAAAANAGRPASAQPAIPVHASAAPSNRPAASSSDLSVDAELSKELDNLLTQIQKGEADAALPSSPAPISAASLPDPAEIETSSGERAALGMLEADQASSRGEPAVETVARLPDAARGVPVYLRWLEAVNAPLSQSPESVREAVGKVAILTLVNAVAVLVYVLFVRRH